MCWSVSGGCVSVESGSGKYEKWVYDVRCCVLSSACIAHVVLSRSKKSEGMN